MRQKKRGGNKKILLQFYLCIEPLPTMPHPVLFCIFPGGPLRSHAVDNMQSRTTESSVLGVVTCHAEQQVGSTKQVAVDLGV
jgi:hypothetical protein